MSTILLTGFEAFDHTPVNPAEQVAHHLDGTKIGSAKVVARIITNTFFTCIDEVSAAVMMGEYGGRTMVTVEGIAHNLNDCARYQLHDNDGRIMQGELTAADGPAAYYGHLAAARDGTRDARGRGRGRHLRRRRHVLL